MSPRLPHRLPHKRPSQRALLVGTALLFGPALSVQALPQPFPQAHHLSQSHHLRPAALGTDVVTSSADDGTAGTLRAVLAAAAPGDTVTFDPAVFGAPQTITLSGTEIDISQDVTIQGPGMGLLTVDAGQASYVFNITGGTVAISGMTAANGAGANDDGDLVNNGTLTLTNMALTGSTGSGLDNEATLTAANCLFSGITTANGGAVYNSVSATATLTNCTFSGNSTAGSGGGLYNDGTASLTNCTFSGNIAPFGGAIYDYGTLSVTSCTFSGNTATQSSTGAALYEDGDGTVTSSLFVGSAGSDIDYDAGTLTSGGSNLLSDSGAGDFSTAGTNDQFGVSAAQALVGPLGANGGPTQTCAVLAGSPAIGGDYVSATAADQRGDPRTAARHTIGAYEYGASPAITSLAVSPAAPSVIAGGTEQLAATAAYSDGSTAAVTGTAAWASDTASVATVNAGGLVTSIAPGTVHISAAFGGQTASVLLTVTAPITTVAYTLWNSADGQVQVRAVNSDGSQTTLNTFGPYTDLGDTGVAGNSALWSATALAKSPDGSLRLLWNHPDGRVMLWRLDGLGSPLSITGYGPYTDAGDLGVPGNTALWHAVGLSVGASGLTHLLWDHPDGRVMLWSVADDDTFAVIGGYGPYTDAGDLGVPGNTAVWHGTALADDPDGTLRLLWNHPDGRVMLWNVAASGGLSSLAGFGPYTDMGDIGVPGNTALWRAVAVQAGADGHVHLLWDHPDGRTMLWSVDGSLNLTALAGYGPYVDPQPNANLWHGLGLALTPAGLPYVLWGNGTGRSVLWNIAGDGTVSFSGIFEIANDSSRQPWMPTAVSGH